MPSYPEFASPLCPASSWHARWTPFRPDAVHILVEARSASPRGVLLSGRLAVHDLPLYPRRHLFRGEVRHPERPRTLAPRWFHNAGNGFMVQTDSLSASCAPRASSTSAAGAGGVDTELFRPVAAAGLLDLPRPVFTYVGARLGREEPRRFPRPRPARHQARGRRRPAAGQLPRALSRRGVHGLEEGRGAELATTRPATCSSCRAGLEPFGLVRWRPGLYLPVAAFTPCAPT